ncbi:MULTISPECIES: UDP-glucose 4-epimerase family protein [Pseudomonas]|uniref:UDP-glucose 4-epimerase family protein n=1 Tax=Pseudomonas TaxID=286 RepID=UPI0003081862|nr:MULTISPECIES: SDR family oxidoreductase [Pseudomonas]AOX10511.1 nucleoside-diphosphate sugar epimerase [Pseudomonas putida JB]MDN4514267.1 SDR family oxidoreductase [Pseudomonas sp. 2,4-D]MDW2775161.1 SDR family oxidoreductase [Pseudomonas sp. BEA3.1]RIZ44249.1 nucleoside-diphosphate sugar epimerase [Pseudomonas putida]TFF52986.1 nucleoside-diphosphate sugar epimerase [Pseudomonas putida]
MSHSAELSAGERILVTGSTGFVGGALLNGLIEAGRFDVVAQYRERPEAISTLVDAVCVPSINGETDWKAALEKVDVVVHCAARVHVMNETTNDPLAAFRRVNVDGTLALARQAASAGVRRFIYLSSIKVNGEETSEAPFNAQDNCSPTDPYGISKWEAEQGLLALAAESAMDVVIVRPPLIYGPGVKANFLKMVKWMDRGIPLPLASVHNSRSLVGLSNLISFLIHCIDHPNAGNQIFLVSDGQDLSTPALLSKVAGALGKSSRLIPFPVSFLLGLAALVGKKAEFRRLCGSLTIDIEKNRRLLGWQPQSSVSDELKRTVKAYRQQESK